MRNTRSLLIAAAALVLLPFALHALGLTLKTATDVVIFAIAAMGLNILVGTTGLVSFGHGVWFGLGAFAAAILQRSRRQRPSASEAFDETTAASLRGDGQATK